MWTLPILYRGYLITKANPTGGKAGKGRNKTSTIQVFADGIFQNYWTLLKHFRFKIGDMKSYQGAVLKAKGFVDELEYEKTLKEAAAIINQTTQEQRHDQGE